MRRLLSILALAAAVVCLSGCYPYLTPPGDPPLRYRDQVFSDVDVTSNLRYGQAVDQFGQTKTLRLDLYQPRGDTNTRRPAIVWVHGGGFAIGNRLPVEIVDEATTFAKKGFVSVSIDYRLYPPLLFLGCPASFDVTPACAQAIRDATHDAQAAVRFLRAHAASWGIDPSRIAIGGTSAGATVAMETAFNADDPGTSGHPRFSSAVRGAVSLSGAHVLGTVDPTDAPTLLFHGTADTIVPYSLAAATVADARAAGLHSWLTTWDGGGHVPYFQHRDDIINQTTNFLYWEMDLDHAAR